MHRLCRTAMSGTSAWYARQLARRVSAFRKSQGTLADALAVNDIDPQGYGDSLRERVRNFAARHPGSALLTTSGSTGAPKEIWYPPARTEALQREFLLQALLGAEEFRLKGSAIYFLTSLAPSTSLSSALLKRPCHSPLERLAFLRSIIFEPAAQEAARMHSELWVHLALMIIAQPALLVAANPSSILLLAGQAVTHWDEGRHVIRALLPDLWQSLSPARRLAFGGRRAFEQALDRTDLPQANVMELFPDLEAVLCWTGGYVGPYLERVRALWPEDRLRVIPLCSLSTETVMGLSYPDRQGCVPLYPEVLYEFLGEDGQSPRLLRPWALSSGQRYRMVVSDRFGLQRYDTGDVFECIGSLGDVPELEFRGRSGLSFSFTGEKITGDQLSEAYRIALNRLGIQNVTLSCVPDPGNGNRLPRYMFVATSERHAAVDLLLARTVDEELKRINGEYGSKRQSERLGDPGLVSMTVAQLIACLATCHPTPGQINVSQLKLLPLYTGITWPDILDSLERRQRRT